MEDQELLSIFDKKDGDWNMIPSSDIRVKCLRGLFYLEVELKFLDASSAF